VLCQRCARACGELVANHTLGLRERGAETMIHADANVPFGESTCISCGTCLQVCPTGSLVDRRSSFMGRGDQTERVKSVCNKCSVGCGMQIVTRGGNVLRIEGDWDASVNSGLLCKAGRFDPLYDERTRITQPLIRRKGKLEPASWNDAIKTVAKRLDDTEAKEIALLVSGDATNEALYLAGRLFQKELRSKNVGLISGAAPEWIGKKPGTFADLIGSDMLLLVGANPVKDQPVASFRIKRLVDKGMRLVVVDDGENGLAPFAETTLKLADIGKAIEIANEVDSVTVLYGAGLTEKAARTLKKLGKKARFVALEPGVNTRAAVSFGMHNGFKAAAAKVLYVLLGEQEWEGEILNKAGDDAFVIAQACYASALTDRADVVLPAAIWSERSGSLTNTEGCIQTANRAVEPEGEAKPDWEILSLLADKLGKKLGASFDDISARAAKELK
jgi:formate dehydrogenase major subunit